MLFSVSVLVGAVLGTRYNVLCLVPTTLAGALLVGAVEASASSGWAIALDVGLLTLALQVGYGAGIGLRYVLAVSRAVPVSALRRTVKAGIESGR